MPGARLAAPSLRLGSRQSSTDKIERLILGSFPSEASLAAGQYYAHPPYQFWRLLSELLGEPLAEIPYRCRLQRVLAHRLGIWDVLDGQRRCIDSKSKSQSVRTLRLATVAFNGQAAGRFAADTAACRLSPAHAGRSFEQKLAVWRAWWAASPCCRDSNSPRCGQI